MFTESIFTDLLYAKSTCLGASITTGNKKNKIPALMKLTFSWGQAREKQKGKYTMKLFIE